MVTVPITFKNTDGAQWGAGKGSRLNSLEVDQNFYELKKALEELNEGPEGVGIFDIAVVGNAMTITMTDLTTRGPFTLPTAIMQWVPGGYLSEHEYGAYNLFTSQEGMYLVLQTHVSAVTFDPDAANVNGPLYSLIFPYPNHYSFGLFYPYKPGFGLDPETTMFAHVFRGPVILPVDLEGSIASLESAATNNISFPILHDAEEVGSIDFAAGELFGTFSFPTMDQFIRGDRFRVLAPVTLDDTARGLAVTIAGTVGEIS